MPLFDISRNTSKTNDAKLVKKAKIVNKATPTIKGGSGLLDRISQITSLVESKLGYLRDNFILIQDMHNLEEYIRSAIDNKVLSIDTETTGLDPLLDDIAGVCIYTKGQKGAYIPINHVSYITNAPVANQLTRDQVKEALEHYTDTGYDIIMFNAVFDIRVLRNTIGLHNIYCTWDCYIAQRLLNENEDSNALKPLHQKYVLNGKSDAFTFDELFNGIPFTMIPLKTAYLYASNDPKITYELYEYQKKYLCSNREDMQALYKAFTEIEMPCLAVVADMEDNGVNFDTAYQKELSEKYNKLLEDELQAFYELLNGVSDKILEYKSKHPNNKLDERINIASPTQLSILFYDVLGCEVIDAKHPRGTGEDILKKMNNPIANAVLEYRTLAKLVDTYIDKLPNCVNPNDGRIHCKFNQYGAVTGRFSSSNPNLQNIPSHNKDIRKMFIASDGYVLMSSDYSQQEPKCLAALCKQQGDLQMFNTFMANKDLYSEIASKAFNTSYENCLEFYLDENGNKTDKTYPEGKERRTQAKSILLGVLYGRGVKSIAEQLGCTPEKAQQIKDSVFRGFPAIKKFEQDSLNMAYELGYVTTVAGRKRRLPDLQLDEYEFRWVDDTAPDDDLLNFDSEVEQEIPERTIRRYLTKLHNCRFNEKRKIFEQANKEGIWIVDNGAKISDSTTQCVNSRIQGSAADLTKVALINLNNNERLKELGFRLLIPVHDEVIAECPEENAKECSELLAKVMSDSAESLIGMPVKCDVEITKAWYGEAVNI